MAQVTFATPLFNFILFKQYILDIHSPKDVSPRFLICKF